MRLGDIITLNKEPLLKIEDSVEYIIAGVQSYGKGILNKRKVHGNELKMRKYKVIKQNQLMWCKVDTKNGGFGITSAEHIGSLASTNMALADIDLSKAEPKFIELLFRNKWFYGMINSMSKGTTNRKYLKPKEVCDLIQVPDLTLEEQKEFVDLYLKIDQSELRAEIERQQDLVKALRQSILQKAVQGKLTKSWRANNLNIEPASELLKRIEAEKQKLIADKKIKKEKSLPSIEEDEIPYEVPDTWVWCRFQDIIYSGYTGLERSKNFQSLDYTYGYFKMNNIGDYGQCNWDKFTHVEASDDEVVKYSLKKNDFLFNTRNSYELVGKTCIIDKDYTIPLLFNNNIFKVDFGGKNDPGYINLMFSSPVIKKLLDEKKSATTNVAAIYQGKLMELLVVIPPLKEQKAIVEKVNSLMALCDELEQQIETSQTQIELLMQSCLKEVFEYESN